uniref:PIN domain-containing protein n=1 Tax=Candidatus Kentrum sp. TUN TaxID=2126343 RepID=A0A451AVR0_9GAMM|nr:MAG: hypothetical protein BECKTUN1418F_GA0071002_12353 [Candidatus Kentron sp. TUN]VFK64433.1 MAG: hypothetical protein BECKTUN1418D_GA0071000_12603 [Candidatus Kentron sp. TUN]VFK70124.1 MAG: hypothetical protein BECKTUN1418E_GA0071001_12383 [Candidatus Kentron sp. TUN]
MRIYLDNCCFNRPFDDQSSLTIRLETEAKLEIQKEIKSGIFALGWSYILDYENDANPFVERWIEIQAWKDISDSFVSETTEILADMNALIGLGLKPIDSLHIACAIALECEYFITVDKGILKKSVNISKSKIINPIDFIIQRESGV